MTRSFDRTTGSLDNARTYLFSNVVPQAADLNQGPWANLENDLGDLARVQGREVYIITGPAGNKGTLKDEGKVVIPTSTWKVAVILPHDHGLADIARLPRSRSDRGEHAERSGRAQRGLEHLPHDGGCHRSADRLRPAGAAAGQGGSGGRVQHAAAARRHRGSGRRNRRRRLRRPSTPPARSIRMVRSRATPGTSATASTGSGASVTHTFAQDGAFTVRVTVTDNDGLTDSATFVVNVTNVAPVVGTVPNATLNVGATYTAAGTFTDPGADAWTATVHWGDGSAPEVVPLSGHSFSLTHIYTAGGTYTVTIDIADDDTSVSSTPHGHRGSSRRPSPDSRQALPLIDKLIATGKIPRGVGLLLKAEVIAAQVLIGRGNERGCGARAAGRGGRDRCAGPLPRGQGRRCGAAAQGAGGRHRQPRGRRRCLRARHRRHHW